MLPRCIAFHSYKGGTGKTTIASNLAAILVGQGYRVALLDLDVYAPSLHAYFDYSPQKWINDFFNGAATIAEIVTDMTSVIEGHTTKTRIKPGGKFWLVLSNPQKEEIIKLEGQGRQTSASIQLLRKFIELRETLVTQYNCQYVIIDTSPGIRYWSINSLALADTILLALKLDKLDIDGTRKMTMDMYGSLKKLGGKSFLLLNRTNGYCVPHLPTYEDSNVAMPQQDVHKIYTSLLRDTGMDIISTIPCYCDIQFSTAEFLTSVRYPDHPFSKLLSQMAESDILKV